MGHSFLTHSGKCHTIDFLFLNKGLLRSKLVESYYLVLLGLIFIGNYIEEPDSENIIDNAVLIVCKDINSTS